MHEWKEKQYKKQILKFLEVVKFQNQEWVIKKEQELAQVYTFYLVGSTWTFQSSSFPV